MRRILPVSVVSALVVVTVCGGTIFGAGHLRASQPQASDGPLFLFAENDKWGLMDRTGTVVVPAAYEQIGPDKAFEGMPRNMRPHRVVEEAMTQMQSRPVWHDLVRARADGKWGWVGRGGVAIAPQFDDAEEFYTEALAPAKRGRRWGYVDRTGRFVIEPAFDDALPFACGLARVSKGNRMNGKQGFIDATGRMVIPQVYDAVGEPCLSMLRPNGPGALVDDPDARDRETDLITVVANRKQGYVDRTGRVVVEPNFAPTSVTPRWFQHGRDTVRVDGKEGYVDRTGQLVIPAAFDSAGSFFSGAASVRVGDKYGYIDTDGAFLVEPRFDAASPFEGDQARVRVGDLWGLIDRAGRFVAEPQWTGAGQLREGLRAVEVDGRWGYVDDTGSMVIAPAFEFARGFSEGRAVVTVGGLCGYIDRLGQLVIRAAFVEAKDFEGGLALTSAGDTAGYLAPDGSVIRTMEFEGYARRVQRASCGGMTVIR